MTVPLVHGRAREGRAEPRSLELRLRENQRRVPNAEVQEQALEVAVHVRPGRVLGFHAAVARHAPNHLAAVPPCVQRGDAGVCRADELQNDVGPLAPERTIEAHHVEE